MEDIVNILKWTMLINGIVLLVVILITLFITKRVRYLEKTLAETVVLVLTNPHTDQKLVEHFNSIRLKEYGYFKSPEKTNRKLHQH